MNGLSLFSNVGIAETYISPKIKIKVANELLENRSNFYKEMHPNCQVINGDITNKEIYSKVFEEAKNNNCEFLIATPPCQGFSVSGKMNENDIRNSLIKYVVNMIKDLSPKNTIIENVPGVLKAYILHNNEKIKIIDFIESELGDKYNINYKVVDTSEYGTPQKRKRAIFLISSIKQWEFPKTLPPITVREAIGHLPSLESGQKSNIKHHNAKIHNDNHILWLTHTPTGKTALNNDLHYPKKDGRKIKAFLTTYKRIDWDKPSPTITMGNGSISSQNNVHPGRLKKDGTYSDARVLTLKEIFILTGLPEKWSPPSWASENLIRGVIGEGVPPKLIQALVSTMPN